MLCRRETAVAFMRLVFEKGMNVCHRRQFKAKPGHHILIACFSTGISVHIIHVGKRDSRRSSSKRTHQWVQVQKQGALHSIFLKGEHVQNRKWIQGDWVHRKVNKGCSLNSDGLTLTFSAIGTIEKKGGKGSYHCSTSEDSHIISG